MAESKRDVILFLDCFIANLVFALLNFQLREILCSYAALFLAPAEGWGALQAPLWTHGWTDGWTDIHTETFSFYIDIRRLYPTWITLQQSNIYTMSNNRNDVNISLLRMLTSE